MHSNVTGAFPIVLQRSLTVTCTAFTAGKVPAVRAVQGDCERVCLWGPWVQTPPLSLVLSTICYRLHFHGVPWEDDPIINKETTGLSTPFNYLLSKLNIWNVNCARATTFIFDSRTPGCSCESVEELETENVSIWLIYCICTILWFFLSF